MAMSGQDIAAVASTQWDAIFEVKLQNLEILDGMYRVFTSVIGDQYNRRLGSFGEMAPIGYNAADIPVSSINYSQTAIPLFPYAYKTVVSDREMTTVGGVGPNSQILQEEAQTHAMALGRYKDYLILNSIFSDLSRFTQIPKTIGAKTGMNAAKIIQARSILQNQGALSPMLNGVMSTLLQPGLAADEQYSSWFYNEGRPLTASSKIPHPEWRYYDVIMRIMGGVGINTLPSTLVGSNYTFNCPIWDKEVITLASAELMPKTTIWYNPGQHRYEIVSEFVMGAGVTQPDGVVYVTADTANTSN